MTRPHLFEFCDQAWVPAPVRECLFEFMSLCLEGFRDYYREVADAALEIALEHDLDTIVELGAGLAPITRRIAEDPRAEGLTLVPCDLHVNKAAYRELADRFPALVEPLYEPVDMTDPPIVPGKTLFVISGSWHHIPFAQRAATFQTLTARRERNRRIRSAAVRSRLDAADAHRNLCGTPAPTRTTQPTWASAADALVLARASRAPHFPVGRHRQLPATVDRDRMAARVGRRCGRVVPSDLRGSAPHVGRMDRPRRGRYRVDQALPADHDWNGTE